MHKNWRVLASWLWAATQKCTSCGGTGDAKPGSGKGDCGACAGTGTATDWR